MKNLFLILLTLFTGTLFSQAPALIPYQAVARDAGGQPLANTTLTARFTLHDLTATGAIVWQELQTVSTSALGLFTVQLGSVSPLTNVNWGNGAKFMQVEINAGNGFVDMGTTQLLSVPYALHAENVSVHVSAVGDTLFLGEEQYVVIPGISEANNAGGGTTTGTNQHSCGATNVHNPNLTYGTMTDQEGNVYKSIVIGTQEWMAENLNTSIYRNGDAISTNLSNSQWSSTTSGAWAYYNNDESYACPYGKLYNWFAVNDSRNLCPVGWHVPSDEEWTVLTNYLGGEGVAGDKMKSIGTQYWVSSNNGTTNESGFSGLPGGSRNYGGDYNVVGTFGLWWSSTQYGSSNAWYRDLNYANTTVNRNDLNAQVGFSVRCLRD